MELVDKMLTGDAQSLARLITMMEREDPQVPEIMTEIQPLLRGAYICGFTGPPGSGKSTLVDKLTSVIRNKGLSVGIIAVDPTSPFTGGAVLGDRIRMQQHYLDSDVFIRSMALRESHGGVPRTVRGVIKLMDAFGKDFILVETVGVGQTELDIIKNADTITVLLTPESGDPIQALKAGLMEIADILVVNKADRQGTDEMVASLDSLFTLIPEGWWQPPILKTQAVNNIGIEELYGVIKTHRQSLEETGRLEERRREQRRGELPKVLLEGLSSKLNSLMTENKELLDYLAKVESGEMDAYSACTEILSNGFLLKEWLT
jgi:LAO/AO transport system kinase